MTSRTIAIATPRYAPDIGGVEKHAEELARGLAARGVPVEVLTCDPTDRLPRIEQRDGVKFYVVPNSALRPIELVRTPGLRSDRLGRA